jgi:hypothetical protein
MVRRALSAVLVAIVLAALPVGWLLMSRASVAVADDGNGQGDGQNKHATATVTTTTTVVETVVATVVQTVEATATVDRTATATATAHSVTTATSTSTVAQPGPTVVRTLAGGQVVHTVVADPSPSPSPSSSPTPTNPFAAGNGGLPVAESGGSPMWPYLLGIIVLGLAGTVGLLMSSRE